MTREEIQIISENISQEWIEDNPDSVYEILQELCSTSLHLYNRIDCANEQIKPYHDLVLELNKENKKLHKLLNHK